MANEAVLPVPVYDAANISSPFKILGITSIYIGVGLLYPFSSIAFNIGVIILRSLKVN